MKIPKQWTFKSRDVAASFDSHVREQLPWYDLATKAVAHLGRHYIPCGGLVYDIGASTGNIGRALADTLSQRQARFEAIEESEEMALAYHGPPSVIVSDALDYDYRPFDFSVCFLTVMFLPVSVRASFLRRLTGLISPGGALVIVDKTNPPDGYAGTALRRLTMSWKLDQGATPEQIVQKELSLSGYQRPINPRILGPNVTPFFTFGEFGGWVIEKPE